MKIRLAVMVAIAAACAGCVSTSLSTPEGWKAKRTAFGLNATVGEVEVQNGDFRAKMKGYQSDSVEAIKAAAQGVAEGLAAGINPAP